MIRPLHVFLLSILIGLSGSLVVGWSMLSMRQDAFAYARANGYNVLLYVQQNLKNDLDSHAQSLQTLDNALVSQLDDQHTGETLRRLLRGHLASHPEVGTILVTDASGRLISDLSRSYGRVPDLSDRDYFKAHVAGDDGLYLSHPLLPIFRNAQPSIALSHRLSGLHGEFLGVAAVIKQISHIEAFFSGLEVGDDTRITVSLSDGTPLAHFPATEAPPRSAGDQQALLSFVASGKGGQLASAESTDSSWRGYMRVGDYPLVVDVEISGGRIYQAWAVRTWVCVGVLVCMNLFIAALACGVVRYMRDSQRQTRALSQAASIDPLTGLANRRSFDARADVEWRHAQQAHANLAVLMIDIDHFKRYNDHYGHQGGDVALQQVAALLRQGCRRQEDFPARYGGEEFIVLLPNCTVEAAGQIAEQLRQSIEQAALSHAAVERGVVSVSIGVASSLAAGHANFASLVEAADQALYQAKNTGRNRVVVSSATPSA
ncbi:MAG: Phytochrome-like protein cph2 [Pseudomonas citronellolis]|nr:MAG: Phytochrome-like protein cph2 [Pseudomonas citronellolis]